MSNPKDNPCYGCVAPKRHIGCHGTCPDYRESVAKRIAKKNIIRKARAIEKYENDKFQETYYNSVEYRRRQRNR
jgi:hypothetical protein